jgi:hypothetical protein
MAKHLWNEFFKKNDILLKKRLITRKRVSLKIFTQKILTINSSSILAESNANVK